MWIPPSLDPETLETKFTDLSRRNFAAVIIWKAMLAKFQISSCQITAMSFHTCANFKLRTHEFISYFCARHLWLQNRNPFLLFVVRTRTSSYAHVHHCLHNRTRTSANTYIIVCTHTSSSPSPSSSSVYLSPFPSRFLHYCSCPNTWLAFFITAPAHPHATFVMRTALVHGTLGFVSQTVLSEVFRKISNDYCEKETTRETLLHKFQRYHTIFTFHLTR